MTVTVTLQPSFNPPVHVIERVCTIKEMGANFIFETYHGALPGSDAFIQAQQVYGPNFSFDSEESRETYSNEIPIASVVSIQVVP